MALGSTQPLTGMFPGGKGGRCAGLKTLPPSCANCHEIWEPQPPGTLRGCNGIALPLMTSLYFEYSPKHDKRNFLSQSISINKQL
jgi:hypothetical protein